MHTISRWNAQFFSFAHVCFRALQPKRRFQPLQFVGLLLITLLSFPTYAQFDCIDPGGTGTVQVVITNATAAGEVGPINITIPSGIGITGIVGSCAATAGTCTVAADGLSVTWNGTVSANSTVTVTYHINVATTVAGGSYAIANASANPDLTVPATSNVLIGCLAQPSSNIRLSDQKPGSVLVYPYYTSVTGAVTNDTRVSITNVSPLASTLANQATVHVFMIQGTSCDQTDFFVCLTPNATFSFSALAFDPDVTGYVLAVVVDSATGLPIQNNVLIGNAFVNTVNDFGNYGAEAFAANSAVSGLLYADYGTTARLFFDGVGYDSVPKQFGVEIQSPVNVLTPFQRIVTVGMNGDLTTGAVTGAAQVGTGQIFNQNEVSRSVNGLLTGACQATSILSDGTVRVAGRLSTLIPGTMSGTIKVTTGGSVGILLTPRNTTWGGIRTLHKLSTVVTSLTIPVLIPQGCPM